MALLAIGSLATVGLALVAALLAIGMVRLRLHRIQGEALAITPERHSEIARLADLAAFRLGIRRPPVFVSGSDEPNAYTLGFWGDHQVVLTSALLELLEPHEILFVLGHEMGHVRREHVSWLTLSAPPTRALQIPFFSFVLGLLFRDWQLRAEYAADRAGLLAARDLRVSVQALMKVAFRSATPPSPPSGAQREVPRDVLDRISEYTGTHPLIGNRIARLNEFAAELRQGGVL